MEKKKKKGSGKGMIAIGCVLLSFKACACREQKNRVLFRRNSTRLFGAFA